LDSISLIMFVIPILPGLIFSMISYVEFEAKKQTVFSLMSNILAGLSWVIFGLTWPAVATSDMEISIAYLWYVMGIIYFVFAVANGMRMLGAIFHTDTAPKLTIQNNDHPEETE